MESPTFEESKRLMYVGMIRPKELLITTSANTSTKPYGTKWLEQITSGVDMNPMACQDEYLTWFGNRFQFVKIDYTAPTDQTTNNVTLAFPVLKTPSECRTYKLREVQPSRVPQSERLDAVEFAGSFAERLIAQASDNDDAVLGNCLHHLLCIYQNDPARVV